MNREACGAEDRNEKDYGDGYVYKDLYSQSAVKSRKKRRRKRKKHHPVLFLLAAVLVVLCYQKFQNGDWSAFIFSKDGGIGKAAALEEMTAGGGVQDTMQALEAMAQADPKARPIVKNPEQYPERLLSSLGRNSELLDFTLDYPQKKGTFSKNIDLSGRAQKGQIPLLMQWDEEWGYAPYGNGIIALDGCGPTCLSMVTVGLTGDMSQNPKKMAEFSERNGYLDEKSDSTRWTLMSDGARQLGLNSRELSLSRGLMVRELKERHPIICCMGPGDFTTQGHFIVLSAVQDGEFCVLDPNSKQRSRKTWSYDRLKPQIRNLWAISNS
ncbi:MAG: C39 family peptidase [Oscillospiraceae bacterium]|nr:C39 family peptidase [Oscillospiraceae bacterium]